MSTWTPPPGLDVPAPRRVKMNTFWRGFIVFIFLLFMLPLATILPSELALTSKMAALKDHGIEVAAQVDKEDEQTTKHGTIYIVTYHYRPVAPSSTADSFSGKSRMSTQEYVDISIGEKIPIVYDSRNPNQSATKTQLDLNSTGLNAKLPMLLLALFIGIPAVMTGFMFYMYFREKKLLQLGDVVPARIVSAEDYTQRGRRFSKVTYEFKDSSGATITGIRKGVPTADDTRARFVEYRARCCGNPTAIYDPQNSRRNMLYPPAMATFL